MDIGSIGAIALNEKDPTKINFAIQQLIARNSGAQINAVVAKSAAYTLQPSDFTVEVTGNTTITLPSPSAAPGQLYCIKKMDSAATTATIGGTVDGTVNPTITVQYEVWLVQSSGTAWDRIIKYTAPVSISGLLLNTNNLSDVSNAATSRTNLGLGTAAVLDVGTTASKVLQLDGSAKIPAVDGSQLTNLPVYKFSKSFTSSQQTITSGGGLTLAHSLGETPTLMQCRLVCTSTDAGYAVNDEITISPLGGDNTNCGIGLWPDATNVNVIFGSAATAIQYLNKTTGALTALTNSKWNLVVRAWA